MSNAIYALLEVNSKILRKSTKELYEKLATWFFYKVIHPRIQPKQLPRIIIQFLRETIGSLTITVLIVIVFNCNCNCKYGKLYSTVGGKPLLRCFTRMFTVSALSNARDCR